VSLLVILGATSISAPSVLRRRSPLRRLDVTRTLFGLLVVMASVLAATVTVVGYHKLVLTLAVFGVALATVFQVLSWRAALGCFPFGSVPLLVLNSVGLFGVLFYRSSTHGAVSASLPSDSAIYKQATLILILASLALWCGGLIATIGARRISSRRRPDFHHVLHSVAQWKLLPTVIASSVPLAFGIAGVSVSGLWSRPGHLETYGPTVLVKLSSVLLPMGLAGTALLLFNSTHSRSRPWGVFLLSLYATFLFSTGSRAIVLLPLVLFGTYLLLPPATGTRRRINPIVVIAIAVLTAFLLHLPLALRGGDAGLAPHIARITADPSILWANPLDSIGNVLFSVPLTGFVSLHENRLPLSYLLTSINPLPGSMTDWNRIKDNLRVNAYTPFNTFGELALYGLPFLAAYFVVAGFVTTRLQLWASRLVGMGNVLAHIVVAACMPFFSFMILQYNLRSSTRLLWYAALIVLLLQIFSQRRSRSLALHFTQDADDVVR
jgi:hypothetical protein